MPRPLYEQSLGYGRPAEDVFLRTGGLRLDSETYPSHTLGSDVLFLGEPLTPLHDVYAEMAEWAEDGDPEAVDFHETDILAGAVQQSFERGTMRLPKFGIPSDGFNPKTKIRK